MGISIVTDAGVTRGSRSALACIVQDGVRRWKVVALFPEMAPSDAELMAGVLGAAVCDALASERSPSVWFTDSRAAQSAFGRWRGGTPSGSARFVDGWLSSVPFMHEVECRHVSESTHQRSHHACHRVCTWVQRRGPKLLARHGEGPLGILRTTKPEEAWFLVSIGELDGDPASEVARVITMLKEYFIPATAIS